MEPGTDGGRSPDRLTPGDCAGSAGAADACEPGTYVDPKEDHQHGFVADIGELEEQVIDDDLRLATHDSVTEGDDRLASDRVLLRALADANFGGRLYHMFQEELARYAIDVLICWIRGGKIGRICRDKGRPVDLSMLHEMDFSYDDLLELAIETVARAMRFFVEEVLKKQQWDPRRGASIKTFFLGACILEFSNTYKKWQNEQERWLRIAELSVEAGDLQDGALADRRDLTADIVLTKVCAEQLADGIKDTKTRSAVQLVAWGFSYAEAGACVGLSERAVEGRLKRLRVKANSSWGGPGP